MITNCITASIFTANPEDELIFQKFELLFDVLWSNRSLDWSITRPNHKILRYTEVSDINWNMAIDYWKLFASIFIHFDADIEYQVFGKSIIIDVYCEDFSVCIIVNFNV